MTSQQQTRTVVHDIRGQICPSCLLFTLREVNEQRKALQNGTLQLLIMTDNRDATTTIPTAVASMGYAHSVHKKKGYYEIRIMPPVKNPPAEEAEM